MWPNGELGQIQRRPLGGCALAESLCEGRAVPLQTLRGRGNLAESQAVISELRTPSRIPPEWRILPE